MLGWLVDRKIAPQIPVSDKASRTDGTSSREDFEWDPKGDQYICQKVNRLRNFAETTPIQTEAHPAQAGQNIAG
jgi:hypothetical protein